MLKKHGKNNHEHKQSETKESPKFVLKVSQRLHLKHSNKHIALQNLSIYHTWKNTRKQYKNSKLKIITPTWNDKLPDSSYPMPNIEDNFEYII